MSASYVGVLVDSTARRGWTRGVPQTPGGAGHRGGGDDNTNGWVAEGLLSSGAVGVLVTDPTHPDNVIIYANAGFEQLTGRETGRLEMVEWICRVDMWSGYAECICRVDRWSGYAEWIGGVDMRERTVDLSVYNTHDYPQHT